MKTGAAIGLRAGDWVAAGILALLGIAAGLAAPSVITPQPVVLLPVILVLADTGLSGWIARRNGRPFSGLYHFVILLLFASVLFVISILSGLEPELVVLLPLVVREATLLSRLF